MATDFDQLRPWTNAYKKSISDKLNGISLDVCLLLEKEGDLCVKACPVNALEKEELDQKKCFDYCFGEVGAHGLSNAMHAGLDRMISPKYFSMSMMNLEKSDFNYVDCLKRLWNLM